jgi:hypothetical protein
MTTKLYSMLLRRYKNRDKDKPWVFWQRYWSRKEGKFVEGPFQDRKKIMGTLCRKVGVRYFRFHPPETFRGLGHGTGQCAHKLNTAYPGP